MMGVWRTLLDGVFGLASALLAVFFGAALANVLRGVPLQADGFFFLPLWTNWQPGESPGILDWYTVIGGLVALVALTLHGALWLTIKTSGDLEQRAQRIVAPLLLLLAALTATSLIATIAVRPSTLDNYFAHPVTFVIPAGVIASLLGIWFLNRKADAVKAFLCSCSYLFFMLAGACWGVYPSLLPATTGPDRDITLNRALSGPHTLAVGLVWWSFGMTLAVCYVVFVYSRFRGKADAGHCDTELRSGPNRPALLPGSEKPPHKHQLANMVGIVIRGQQRLSQDGLPVAMRNGSEQIRRVAGHQIAQRLVILAKCFHAVLPCFFAGRGRCFGPISCRELRRFVLWVPGKLQDVPLRNSQVFHQFPGRMLCALWAVGRAAWTADLWWPRRNPHAPRCR